VRDMAAGEQQRVPLASIEEWLRQHQQSLVV
jgi:hypothetical protein